MVIARSRARRLALLVLAMAAAGSACAKEQPAPAASASAPAASSATTGASSAVPLDLVPLPPDTAAAELKEYRLTIPKLERWAKTTSALNAVTAAHPDAVVNMQRDARIKTLDQLIVKFGSEPLIRPALLETGMNAREYLLTMMAMQSAWTGYMRSAGGTPLPTDLPPALVENIAFLRANMPAVQHILGTIKNNPPPKLPATPTRPAKP